MRSHILCRLYIVYIVFSVLLTFGRIFCNVALWCAIFIFDVKALSHYNVLANVCRRMKIYLVRWHTLKSNLKNQRRPLSELMQSVRETNIERVSNL